MCYHMCDRAGSDSSATRQPTHLTTPAQGLTLSGAGYTAYILNMTSQTWLNAATVSRSVWWHFMMVVVPVERTPGETGLLWISGAPMSLASPLVALCF